MNTDDVKRHSAEQELAGYGGKDERKRKKNQEGRETDESHEGILAATF